MWLDFLASKAPNSGWELWINLHGVTGREQDPANEEHARWLLEGMDGVVFVVDSSRARLEDNRLAFASLQQMKAYCRQPPAKTVLLFNKRDLPAAELASVDEIAAVFDPRRELEFAEGAAREDVSCVIGALKASIKPAIAPP
jgi:signal recognition particle receptor subunit beta